MQTLSYNGFNETFSSIKHYDTATNIRVYISDPEYNEVGVHTKVVISGGNTPIEIVAERFTTDSYTFHIPTDVWNAMPVGTYQVSLENLYEDKMETTSVTLNVVESSFGKKVIDTGLGTLTKTEGQKEADKEYLDNITVTSEGELEKGWNIR